MVTLKTNFGDIVIELDAAAAPLKLLRTLSNMSPMASSMAPSSTA